MQSPNWDTFAESLNNISPETSVSFWITHPATPRLRHRIVAYFPFESKCKDFKLKFDFHKAAFGAQLLSLGSWAAAFLAFSDRSVLHAQFCLHSKSQAAWWPTVQQRVAVLFSAPGRSTQPSSGLVFEKMAKPQLYFTKIHLWGNARERGGESKKEISHRKIACGCDVGLRKHAI